MAKAPKKFGLDLAKRGWLSGLIAPPLPTGGGSCWAGLGCCGLKSGLGAAVPTPRVCKTKKKAVVCHTFHTLNVAHPPPPCIHVPDMAHTSLQTSSILEIKLEPAQKKKKNLPKKRAGEGKITVPNQINFHTVPHSSQAQGEMGRNCPGSGAFRNRRWVSSPRADNNIALESAASRAKALWHRRKEEKAKEGQGWEEDTSE